MNENNYLDIKAVDLLPFIKGPKSNEPGFPSEAQLVAARQIDISFRSNGFLVLKNFGLSEHLLNSMQLAAKELFGLDEAHKRNKLFRIDNNLNVGYIPIGIEILNPSRPPDIKEVSNVHFMSSSLPFSNFNI